MHLSWVKLLEYGCWGPAREVRSRAAKRLYHELTYQRPSIWHRAVHYWSLGYDQENGIAFGTAQAVTRLNKVALYFRGAYVLHLKRKIRRTNEKR